MSMAWIQRSSDKRRELEEQYPQAAAHFRDFAKVRIPHKAEFARAGSSWTFPPKGDTGHAPYERATVGGLYKRMQIKHRHSIARPKKNTKKKNPRQD